MISFLVPGEPVGKARARVTMRGTYTPKKTADAERLVAWACKQAIGAMKPIEGPVRVAFDARFSHPKSWSKKRKAATYWHTSKPDTDNILKLIKDALNKVAWIDDSQVASLGVCNKIYTEGESGLLVKIDRL